MPTVLRSHGFVVKIFFNDHAPAHVHVLKSGTEVVITLDPVIVLRCWRASRRDVAESRKVVEKNRSILLKAWREVHVDE